MFFSLLLAYPLVQPGTKHLSGIFAQVSTFDCRVMSGVMNEDKGRENGLKCP
jgi:hypothetical protein